MRFMVIVHAVSATESQKAAPDPKMMARMGRFNDELVEAGIMRAGEGLHPSAQGTRLHFAGGKVDRTTKGPFAAPEDRIDGFWLWEVTSEDEALAWANRAPMENGDILELRQIMESVDLGKEVEQQDNGWREKLKQGA